MKLKRLTSNLQRLRPTLVSLPFSTGPRRMRGSGLMKRNAAFLRGHPLCGECKAEGIVAIAEEVDHIAPLWKGGPDEEANLQGLCKDHHKAKTAKEAQERASGRWA